MTTTAIIRLVSRSAVYASLSSTLLGLGGCGYYDSRTAHKAQVTMIGMTEEDVQACAGIPTRTQTISSHVKILEYQRGRNIGAPTTSSLIPVQSVVNVVRDVGGGDGNSCIADFRIVDGKVGDVYYSGDDDMLVGTDGVCSRVVRGCVRRAVASGSPPDFWKTSAFMQPQPNEPPAAADPSVAAPPISESPVLAPPFAATDNVPGAASAPSPSTPGAGTSQGTTPAISSDVTPAIPTVKDSTPGATASSGVAPIASTVTVPTSDVTTTAKTVPAPPAMTAPETPPVENPAAHGAETQQKL